MKKCLIIFSALKTLLVMGVLVAISSVTRASTITELVELPKHNMDTPWPTDAWPLNKPLLKEGVEKLNEKVDILFSKRGRADVPDTRALLIIQSGEVVFERYADGFNKDSRFTSWSVAKSYTQALTGILVKRGVFSLDVPAPVPEWQTPDDPRREITLRHLLNMTSGVDNSDSSGAVFKVLFGDGAHNVTHYAAEFPLIEKPGNQWAYSTSTTTVIAGLIGNATGQSASERRSFIKSELLAPIGADNTTFAFDKSGHFIGGSHVYATARDYARFGLLYLHDGIWDGNRILPEGWVDFARTRAPVENNGVYGGHFWLNQTPKGTQMKTLPSGPESVFLAGGNLGQYIYIIPTHDMVMVRLGDVHADSNEEILEEWKKLNINLAAVLSVFPSIKERKNEVN